MSRLLFLGDSLMQENGPDTYPQTGWPQALKEFLRDPDTPILDFAKNGRSTKSFEDEGLLAIALDAARPGDIAFIGFGHNDEKDDPSRHADARTDYLRNIDRFRKALLEKGVKEVIVLTPIARLRYGEGGELLRTHGDYPSALREHVGKEGIPLIDLEELTTLDLLAHSRAHNERHYMVLPPGKYPCYPEGKDDTTHLTEEGARWICSLVAEASQAIPSLSGIMK